MHTPHHTNRRTATALLLGALLPATGAWAVGGSPVSRMYENMARSNKRFATPQNQVRAEPTLIRGLYRLVNRQGEDMGFVNTAGTLYGSTSGFTHIPPKGGGTRQLSGAALEDLRQEMLMQLDAEQLIRVPYGDGGGRRVLLISALDCPVCKRLENTLAQVQGQLNTTFVVLPSALRPVSHPSGAKVWAQVSSLWCAPDQAQAWHAFWREGSLPPASSDGSACAFSSPQKAMQAYLDVFTALQCAGLEIKSVPSMVLENGSLLRYQRDHSNADWLRLLGPEGTPRHPTPTPRWLQT